MEAWAHTQHRVCQCEAGGSAQGFPHVGRLRGRARGRARGRVAQSIAQSVKTLGSSNEPSTFARSTRARSVRCARVPPTERHERLTPHGGALGRQNSRLFQRRSPAFDPTHEAEDQRNTRGVHTHRREQLARSTSMNDDESKPWIRLEHAAPWRIRLAKMVDGPRAQMAVTATSCDRAPPRLRIPSAFLPSDGLLPMVTTPVP